MNLMVSELRVTTNNLVSWLASESLQLSLPAWEDWKVGYAPNNM